MATTLLDLDVAGASVCGLTICNYAQIAAEAEGGAAVSGSALYTVDPYIAVGAGSIAASGTASIKVSISAIGSGGPVASGAADYQPVYAASGAGLASISSEATSAANYVGASSGSIAASGSGGMESDFSAVGSGGAVASGAASSAVSFPYVATGLIRASGAVSSIHVSIVLGFASGGMAISGEAWAQSVIDTKGLPVFLRTFDGDVRLRLSTDGTTIKLWGGQPEMEGGLGTAVLISLFTDAGWWGNALAKTGEEIGSSFVDSLRAPLTNKARLDVEEAARQALAWLTETGIASAVEVSATIPGIGQLGLSIIIRQPEKAAATFRYSVNWQNQQVQLEEDAA